ncbi:MAG: hypothetical protein GKC10_00535 [Methanosarcinales archaeon]|nr:hypothetical protein [Methanosarcinales archaeon]
MNELAKLFLKEKPFQALLAVDELDPAYASLVARRIDSTFAYTTIIISEMERAGLLKSRPEGRVRYLKLTESGQRAAEALKNLRAVLEYSSTHWKRLELIEALVASAEGSADLPLQAGPLRRDLALLKGLDGDLSRLAEDLDRRVCSLLASH